MSEVWPYDVDRGKFLPNIDCIRPFKCLLLMPFESRFNQVAEIIGNTVKEFIQQDTQNLTIQPPQIERLDWVTSSGVIQTEIWEKIAEADLVFCDITGFNPHSAICPPPCIKWISCIWVKRILLSFVGIYREQKILRYFSKFYYSF